MPGDSSRPRQPEKTSSHGKKSLPPKRRDGRVSRANSPPRSSSPAPSVISQKMNHLLRSTQNAQSTQSTQSKPTLAEEVHKLGKNLDFDLAVTKLKGYQRTLDEVHNDPKSGLTVLSAEMWTAFTNLEELVKKYNKSTVTAQQTAQNKKNLLELMEAAKRKCASKDGPGIKKVWNKWLEVDEEIERKKAKAKEEERERERERQKQKGREKGKEGSAGEKVKTVAKKSGSYRAKWHEWNPDDALLLYRYQDGEFDIGDNVSESKYLKETFSDVLRRLPLYIGVPLKSVLWPGKGLGENEEVPDLEELNDKDIKVVSRFYNMPG